MIFKNATSLDVKSPRHKEIASILDSGLSELIRNTPELNSRPFGPVEWRMLDEKDNLAEGPDSAFLFEEFASHGLVPHRLQLVHLAWSGNDRSDGRYSVACHYRMSHRISLEVEGPNRLIVDGIGATFERIAERVRATLEAPATNTVAPATTVVVEPRENWIKRTWRDHTASAVITLVTGLAVLVVGAWFGLN